MVGLPIMISNTFDSTTLNFICFITLSMIIPRITVPRIFVLPPKAPHSWVSQPWEILKSFRIDTLVEIKSKLAPLSKMTNIS